MVKCESWTENMKGDALHMEPRPIPWESKMFRLAETIEELRNLFSASCDGTIHKAVRSGIVGHHKHRYGLYWDVRLVRKKL